eukprot:m.88995 g.88995  ORF g.88995 m.88995 type:complete len:125 (-) comp14960_c2_seq1:1639-2013(-)
MATLKPPTPNNSTVIRRSLGIPLLACGPKMAPAPNKQNQTLVSFTLPSTTWLVVVTKAFFIFLTCSGNTPSQQELAQQKSANTGRWSEGRSSRRRLLPEACFWNTSWATRAAVTRDHMQRLTKM